MPERHFVPSEYHLGLLAQTEREFAWRGQDFAAWQAGLRERFGAMLGHRPARQVPLEVEEVETTETYFRGEAAKLSTYEVLTPSIRKIRRRVTAKDQADAIAQVKAFDEALGLTGLILTKLDGTAKGGVVLGIAQARSGKLEASPIPLLFVGIGEGIDDLRPFVAADFVEALVD